MVQHKQVLISGLVELVVLVFVEVSIILIQHNTQVVQVQLIKVMQEDMDTALEAVEEVEPLLLGVTQQGILVPITEEMEEMV